MPSVLAALTGFWPTERLQTEATGQQRPTCAVAAAEIGRCARETDSPARRWGSWSGGCGVVSCAELAADLNLKSHEQPVPCLKLSLTVGQ